MDSSSHYKPYLDFNPRTPHGVRQLPLLPQREQGGFQSTHPSRGATQCTHCVLYYRHISIHAPLTGCDTTQGHGNTHKHGISIHAPLTGCDFRVFFSLWRGAKFQSTHPSRGATPGGKIKGGLTTIFQSTHPSRGATRVGEKSHHGGLISIHAPLTGCDFAPCTCIRQLHDFNPRTPHGVRPDDRRTAPECHRFQSTHPSRGATKGS